MGSLTTSKLDVIHKYLPWAVNSIKRLMKKQDRLSRKCKKLRSGVGPIPYAMEEQKQIQNNKIQAAMRKVNWNYVESIFTPNEKLNQFVSMKGFWRFVKFNKSDSSGITQLRFVGKIGDRPC